MPIFKQYYESEGVIVTDMDNKFFHKQFNLPMHSFTLEDLVQYMYNEASAEKATAIKAALETDWELREKYDVIMSAQTRLETLDLSSPRKKAIDNILLYADKSVKEVAADS